MILIMKYFFVTKILVIITILKKEQSKKNIIATSLLKITICLEKSVLTVYYVSIIFHSHSYFTYLF